MTNLKILRVKGKDLTKKDLKEINSSRKKEFGKGSKPIKPSEDNDDWNKIYFLIKDGRMLLAFGRLHNVEIKFMRRKYRILGIATMVSIIKDQGYGKLLIEEMKKYIDKKGKLGLGFCNNDLIPFYKKCGLGILENGKQRFIPISNRFPEGAAVYTKKGGLIEEMIKYPKEPAYLSRPQW